MACGSIRSVFRRPNWSAWRRYTGEINILPDPDRGIPAPDVNTSEQAMAWIMDTYSMNQGRTATSVVTGKPLSLGGSLGRRGATGRGVFVIARETAGKLGIPIEGARVAVQGFGNVGKAARIFAGHGAKFVALQDENGSPRHDTGIASLNCAALREGIATPSWSAQ